MFRVRNWTAEEINCGTTEGAREGESERETEKNTHENATLFSIEMWPVFTRRGETLKERQRSTWHEEEVEEEAEKKGARQNYTHRGGADCEVILMVVAAEAAFAR